MLGQFLKTVLGGIGQAAVAGRDPTAELLAVPNPALRGLFASAYYDEAQDWRTLADRREAAYAQAFAGDPLALALDLLDLAPRWDAWKRSQPTTPGRARLDGAVRDALDTGLRRSIAHHGARLPIPAARLAPALEATARLVALGDHGRMGGVAWLEPLIAEAAQRGDPASRAALIAAFERMLAAVRDPDHALRRVEELLGPSGLERSDVPGLVEADRRIARLDAVRAHAFATLGEPLAGAMAAILDGDQIANAMSLPEAVKHPALRALADLSPGDRGAAFHRLLTFLTANQERFGAAGWNEVQKRGGRYTRAIRATTMPTQVGNLLGVLASRKIDLLDADADIAAFLNLLQHFPLLGYKKIIELVLTTVATHPGGRAAAALRAAAAPDRNVHALREHAIAIEDLLRSSPATVAPAPVTPGGFGRKPAAAAMPGLPPIAVPDVDLCAWNADELIGRPYDNILDARLHAPAHRTFLAALADVSETIANLSTEQMRATIPGLIAARGLKGAPGTGNMNLGAVTRAAAMGADLNARFTALAPFVLVHPEPARALGRLASDLGSKSAPSAKWLAEGRALMAPLSLDARLDMLRALTAAPTPMGYLGTNEGQLRALLFLSDDLDPAVLGPLLTDYALKRCYVTLPGVGIRNEKLGNACLWTLAALPAGAGVPYLARILARTKYPKIKAKVDVRLNEAAAAAGIDRATLDELTVPTHDLSADGTRSVALGDGSATIRVVDGRSVTIDWAGAGGKPLKAPSTAMKADGETLKAVKLAAKELEADLAIQPLRIQQLYLADRSWPAATWRERYLDHPLLRALAARLIWWVEHEGGRIAAMPDGDAMADVSGNPVSLDGAIIRLWHPVDATAAEIEQWRDRLEALELTQPFAQAWREVYALTDAERTTGTYSNRWAAHLLKQHQAMTLARLNGWRVTHRMWVDAPNDQPWHLAIPAHGLVADYWVEGAGGDDPETSDSGAYVYVVTDRVQFHVAEGADSARGPARGRAVPLAELPVIVFSEVMRHADLFTAVASIAADPNWLDRGGDAAHPNQWGQAAAAYWGRTNTAELEESGKRRRAMLERIVPRLKIAPQLSLEDRYLTVEGTRHRYRIHLGSGACFRGERHICIVPAEDRSATRLWLPFEGDRTLSIVLSKAALLAADDKITDPVILKQL